MRNFKQDENDLQSQKNTILFIDACIRKDSRTRALAEYAISKLQGDANRVSCAELKPVTDEDELLKREQEAAGKNYQAPEICMAKQFADADIIVIAAPYWDLSFPAILKVYFERINVIGGTFEYNADGIPDGLCRCKKLIYVTTAGGPILSDEYGFGYVKELAKTFYKIPEIIQIKAEGLDIVGADVDAIMEQAKTQIDEHLYPEKL